MDESWLEGRKILVLEPRRIAARAAAEQYGALLIGACRGHRIARADGLEIGAGTRIEVVTEGVFTRMILDDPELSGIAAVLLRRVPRAFSRCRLGGLPSHSTAKAACGDDLRILPMSATLDGARVAPASRSSHRRRQWRIAARSQVGTRYLGRRQHAHRGPEWRMR